MSFVKILLQNFWFRFFAIFITIIGISGIIFAYRTGITLDDIKQSLLMHELWLKANPWVIFLGLVILPGLPVPMTFLLTFTGAIWEGNFTACLLILLALALNMTWTYFVAAYPARGLIEKILKNTSIKIPDLPKQDHLRLILILRLTPGIPLFIHNYILGFFRSPFHLYLPLSILFSGGMSIGIFLTSNAILKGKAGMAIAGVSLIVVAVIVTKLLRSRMARNAKTDPAVAEPPASLEESRGTPDPAADI